MKIKLVLLFCLGLVAQAKAQLLSDSLLIENHHRSFYFLPVAKPKAALVFILHGSQGDGMLIRKYGNNLPTAKIEALAPQENILLVYPNGYKRYWNECRKTAQSAANAENINEEAFFSEMIAYFKSKYEIDEKKVYAIGTSGGGHMAYKLAITMPEKFSAVTAIVANLPDTNNFDCTEKKVAKPIMIINGTLDPVNPYQGGEVVLGGKISLGFVRSTERTLAYWAGLAGYKGQPRMTALPDTDPTDGKTIEKYTFKTKHKPEVTLLKVIGGKHDYPNDIDVYLEAWAFFQRNK